MKQRKPISFFLAVTLGMSLFTGCASNNGNSNAEANITSTVPVETTESIAPATQTDDEPQAVNTIDISYEEGTSDTDNIVNTSSAEKVLLVVSFGTSFNQSRNLTIGGIETAIKNAYPDYQVRRAFTSQIIIDKLAERDKLNIDNIEQAMDRLVLDKVKEVVVQPTTVMSGFEYDDVIAAVTPYAGKFESLKIGEPLLTDDSDYDAVAEIIVSETSQFRENGTAIVFMGHGTHHEANATYTKLQGVLSDKGYDDYLIGLVEGSEGSPLIDHIQAKLTEMEANKAVLRPLMVVAGDHANNDMAGAEEDSWKTILTNEGYAVETVVEGLGQVKGIQDIYCKHVQNAIDSERLTTSTAAENAAAVDLLPDDGTYTIEVETDSSMFKIVECQLTVENASMSAVVTLSGQGFSQLYCGTGEQALADGDKSHFYQYTENGERHSFNIPVEALDAELKLAGFSAKREEWYDYIVKFKSDTLQTVASTQTGTAVEQQIDVALIGGTGRAGVDSPAVLFTKDGKDYARIAWSSPNYSYMVVDDEQYLPVNTEGNSAFEIPITLDTDMTVIACTVAMSAPKEIEYTLNFDSASIR